MDPRASASCASYNNLPHQERLSFRYIINRENVFNSSNSAGNYLQSPDLAEELRLLGIEQNGVEDVTFICPMQSHSDLIASGSLQNCDLTEIGAESYALAMGSLYLSRLVKAHYENGPVPDNKLYIVLPIPVSTMQHMLHLFYEDYVVLKHEEMASFWRAADYLKIHQRAHSNLCYCYPVETQLFSERDQRLLDRDGDSASNAAPTEERHPDAAPVDTGENQEKEKQWPPNSEESDTNAARDTENVNANKREAPPTGRPRTMPPKEVIVISDSSSSSSLDENQQTRSAVCSSSVKFKDLSAHDSSCIMGTARRAFTDSASTKDEKVVAKTDRPHFSGMLKNRAEAIGNGENQDTASHKEKTAASNNKRGHEGHDEEDPYAEARRRLW